MDHCVEILFVEVVYAQDGLISFELQSSEYAQTVNITAVSSEGSAYGVLEIAFYDIGAPIEPGAFISTTAGDESLTVVWNSSPEIDIKGYKLYYDTDSSEPPYEGVASIYGVPSSADVGNDTMYTLTGLFNDTMYYITVTAYDVSGNESGFSPVTTVVPTCCQGRRGSIASSDDAVDISDLVYLIDYMFRDGPEPACLQEANVNGDASAIPDISDLIYLIDYMFLGGPAPMECP